MSEDMTFRVCCLHPNEFEGAVALQATRICGHGHAFTIKQMNENLMEKGSPYIRINYCKYCCNKNTIGVLDESNYTLHKLLKWIILSPAESESGLYEVKKVKSYE